MRSSAGETILRFGRAVAFFAGAYGFLVDLYLTALVYEPGRPSCKRLLQKSSREGSAGGVVGSLHEGEGIKPN